MNSLSFQYANVPLFQVYLISSNQLNEGLDENNNELEIDEVQPDDDLMVYNENNLIYLTSQNIEKEPESSERYHCPIWTQGLERSFKVSRRGHS